jgi:serine/threonine protein kinase/tetratricopeptide (TPR) repeat protein
VLPERSFLDELADSVADGREIDWSKAESSARTPRERALVGQLRLLAQVGALRELDTPESMETASFVSPRSSPPGEVVQDSGRAENDGTETAARVFWRHLEIGAEIGKGAFGTVYRAWDPNLHREVALKLVDVDADEIAIQSTVINEARLLARVRHPNVVAIYGADRSSGKIGLWMEFVQGRTLREIVSERGPFSPREAIGICLELSRALAAVHAAGLIHRDIKAQNVMREQGGRIVLMDFGAGEELGGPSAGRLKGTPVYMAPELVDGEPATPCSDVYSLGVLLFYLVTRAHPVNGNLVEEVQSAHRGGQRKLLRDLRPDAPPAFVQCVEQLIEPDPARRVQTAGAAEAVLLRGLEGTRRTVPRWAAGAAAIAAVVLLGIGLATLGTRWAAAPAVQSLAVLPMVNLSGDPSKEYFVDGMTDLLIAELSRISSLRVTSRTSSMSYKQTTKRIDDIGRELSVDAVLEASLMLSGSQLRLTASLIRPSDQARLWGQSYERPVQDAFILQATMARDLAEAVRLVITPAVRKSLQTAYVASQGAQDLYLRGRYVFYLFDRNRGNEACGLFEQAVAADPKYAVAWASLSRCVMWLETFGLVTLEQARPRVTAAAQTAISLDASLAEAHMALADIQFRYDWDWRGAAATYQRAINASPSFSFARDKYSRFLAAAGRTDEALEQARRGLESDPQSAEARRTFALMLFYSRRYNEALQQTDEATRQEPEFPGGHVVRARTLSALSRYDEAAQSMQQAIGLGNAPTQLMELARIYAAAGRNNDALAVLGKVPGPIAADGFVDILDSAYVLAAIGRRDEALTRLERAVTDREPRVLWLRVDPRVDSLRNTPRFEALLTRIGGLN